jgi:hypothetical protein
MSDRGTISLPYRKGFALPAWLFYVIAIGAFALGWGVLRGVLGLGLLSTLVLSVVPFGLLVWRWERPGR